MNLEKRVQVLDHGYVELIDHMGTDQTIIESARMSTGKGFEGWEKDQRLLTYLYRNRHTTPFEMCEMTIEVKGPIMVFREWQRHRTMSFNEMSARYVQMPNEHYVPEVGRITLQAKDNKQGSSAKRHPEATDIQANIRNEQYLIYKNYDSFVETGVAREIARINTPVSRYSVMRVKTDLHNWLNFLRLRMAPSAQWEIREFANVVGAMIGQLYPRTYALFLEHTLHSLTLSQSEVQQLITTIRNSADGATLLHSLPESLRSRIPTDSDGFQPKGA
jgi:thymidylate synthase (FAD)